MLSKVLVLDDDVNILSAFRDFLTSEGCEMIAASNPNEALRIIEEQRVDLLITDVRLQSSSGVTLFLNARISHPQLPVIVITGYPESIDESTLKSIGADYLLIKPLELERLRQVVRACLRQRNLGNSHRSTLSTHTRKEHP